MIVRSGSSSDERQQAPVARLEEHYQRIGRAWVRRCALAATAAGTAPVARRGKGMRTTPQRPYPDGELNVGGANERTVERFAAGGCRRYAEIGVYRGYTAER